MLRSSAQLCSALLSTAQYCSGLLNSRHRRILVSARYEVPRSIFNPGAALVCLAWGSTGCTTGKHVVPHKMGWRSAPKLVIMRMRFDGLMVWYENGDVKRAWRLVWRFLKHFVSKVSWRLSGWWRARIFGFCQF